MSSLGELVAVVMAVETALDDPPRPDARGDVRQQLLRALVFQVWSEGHGSVSEACRRVGVARGTASAWMARNEAFGREVRSWMDEPPGPEDWNDPNDDDIDPHQFDEVTERLAERPDIDAVVASLRAGHAPTQGIIDCVVPPAERAERERMYAEIEARVALEMAERKAREMTPAWATKRTAAPREFAIVSASPAAPVWDGTLPEPERLNSHASRKAEKQTARDRLDRIARMSPANLSGMDAEERARVERFRHTPPPQPVSNAIDTPPAIEDTSSEFGLIMPPKFAMERREKTLRRQELAARREARKARSGT